MSYADRIRECNEHDLGRYLPLWVAGRRIGWLRKDRVVRVLELCPDIHPGAEGLVLRTEPDEPRVRTAAIAELCTELRSLGDLPEEHGEVYAAVESFSDEPMFTLDRAAVPYFGLRAFGVHLNGYVRTPRGLSMWLAERSLAKPSFPGMLDQLVAGGQPAGLSPLDNLIKECAEEAGVGEELARQAVPAGSVRYTMETERGLKPDEMFCYDLELPREFMPRVVDGEVARFLLLPVEEVMALVRDTRRIKPNCNLVIVEFLVRKGLLARGTVEG